MSGSDTSIERTPLHDLHVELGGKMVPFAGYSMPVQFPAGIMAEHRHTRERAGLFDVSHMGQIILRGEKAVEALETLVPGDIRALSTDRMRYTLFTNEAGGILDDLMVLRRADHLVLVVNAACKHDDLAHLRAHLPDGIEIEERFDRALMALQGPAAVGVVAQHAPAAADAEFMQAIEFEIDGVPCLATRSGYTGEDGFEIACEADGAERVARALLAHPEVEPIGLGARDSLRLEAGLCLYGHDITTETTPIEAGLIWTISKRRRAEGGFPGDATIRKQIADGPTRRRVGIRPEGRVIAREGVAIKDGDGSTIGEITSGGFGPTVEAPVAMGYVDTDHAAPGTSIALDVRGNARPAETAKMPFAPHRYHRG